MNTNFYNLYILECEGRALDLQLQVTGWQLLFFSIFSSGRSITELSSFNCIPQI